MAVRREQVAIGECSLEVHIYGSGAPLVLLHGESGTFYSGAFLQALAKSYEVHVPVHPGWGASTRPVYVRTVRDLALVQQEYIERLCGNSGGNSARSVPLVGLSFGGWVAAEIAATCPALVSHLVLVSPLGIKAGGREDRDYVDLYLTAPNDRLSLYYGKKGAPAWPAGDVDMYAETAKMEEAVARYCWSPYMHDPGLKDRLRRVSAPSLVVSGAEDAFVLNATLYDTYARLLGGATPRRLDGTGHRVEDEQPQLLADLVTKHLGQRLAAVARR